MPARRCRSACWCRTSATSRCSRRSTAGCWTRPRRNRTRCCGPRARAPRRTREDEAWLACQQCIARRVDGVFFAPLELTPNHRGGQPADRRRLRRRAHSRRAPRSINRAVSTARPPRPDRPRQPAGRRPRHEPSAQSRLSARDVRRPQRRRKLGGRQGSGLSRGASARGADGAVRQRPARRSIGHGPRRRAHAPATAPTASSAPAIARPAR